MVKEAIILAGGLGTRLRKLVKDLPKPMADINGKPFLEYIFYYLRSYGVKKIILAIGYKSEIIKDYFDFKFKDVSIFYSEEKELLGTGGAIKQAITLAQEKDVFILNGDTFFDINLERFYKFHKDKNSKISLALKRMENLDRYGVIEIDSDNKIVAFLEKKHRESGLINGGIYLINRDFYLSLRLPAKFSFEKDLLEKYYSIYNFYGLPFDSYFIDIGVPEDYERAKKDFKKFKYG
ncbi:MAG: D-glycero-D-manno-heptose 1-phosphate guanosyltransferase [Candidatus Sericytochromatia bacterium]|nr:MAG: D-glycero-D-manno-heptose 1-phosphate guanosyltransferase [Candidatus Sericytochromatia bacterium]GIX42982.1 MAG: D-glycero-D-manno-heptose 1-phosphate guanosyltransferase [Leptospiraceae bacterium]